MSIILVKQDGDGDDDDGMANPIQYVYMENEVQRRAILKRLKEQKGYLLEEIVRLSSSML